MKHGFGFVFICVNPWLSVASQQSQMTSSLESDEIEPAGRTRHTGRREVVVNGCRAGSGLPDEVLRVELDRYSPRGTKLLKPPAAVEVASYRRNCPE
jgi:hypothetical protein